MLLLYRFVLARSNWLGAVSAPIMCAGYAVLFYTAGTLYSQTLAGLLLVLVIAVLGAGRLNWLGTGLLLGLASGWLAITVVHTLFSLAVIAVWLLAARTEWRWSERMGSVAIMAAGVALVLGLWLVRNQRVLGAPVLTTGGGITLLYGNSDKARWNTGTSIDISTYAPGDSGLSEVELNRYYQEQAFDFIRRNPGRALRLYVLKVLNWFNYRNELAQRSESSRARDILMLVTYGPLLLLFVARLLLAGRMRLSRVELLLAVLYVSNAFAYAVWFTRVRFRLPYDLLLIAVVALFLGNLVQGKLRMQDDA